MKREREAKNEERNPSPQVTFYDGDRAQGNAMGSRADRQGFNNGRYNDRATERAYDRGCER
jgi:hypothetical protein